MGWGASFPKEILDFRLSRCAAPGGFGQNMQHNGMATSFEVFCFLTFCLAARKGRRIVVYMYICILLFEGGHLGLKGRGNPAKCRDGHGLGSMAIH